MVTELTPLKASAMLPFALLVMAVLACWGGGSRSKRVEPVSESPREDRTPANSKTNSELNDNRMKPDEKEKKGFTENLPAGFEPPSDDAGRLLLREYGSLFVAQGDIKVPKMVVFKDQAAVSSFQSTLTTSTESFGGFSLELQKAAMDGLKEAISDARSAGLNISPRDRDSAKRSYDETVGLWASRVDPALKHWVSLGKITEQDASRIRSLSPYEQVPEILKLEAKGIYFSKDLSKSIIYSVAPPGTSQHLSMLALDVKENEDKRVRDVLAKHGWFQTVVSDLPHFTYLGEKESELAKLGLKRVENNGRTFWVPDI